MPLNVYRWPKYGTGYEPGEYGGPVTVLANSVAEARQLILNQATKGPLFNAWYRIDMRPYMNNEPEILTEPQQL
jgi:hypothetical protein